MLCYVVDFFALVMAARCAASFRDARCSGIHHAAEDAHVALGPLGEPWVLHASAFNARDL